MRPHPDEIARRLQHRHHPGWSVWFGNRTRQYWAAACWVRPAGGLIGAITPDGLEAAIASFEEVHPKPALRHAHVVDR
jgi:hypothetical protein